jgi:alpha-1,2-mannosyltransferase
VRLARLPGIRLVRERRFRVLAAAVLLLGALSIHLNNLLITRRGLRDFHDLVGGAQVLLSGGTPYQAAGPAPTDVFLTGPTFNPYPPTAFLLEVPWAAMAEPWRDISWVLLGEAAIIGLVVALYLALGRPSPAEGLLALAGILAFFPLLDSVYFGQLNALLVLLSVLAVLAWQRGRAGPAGLFLALAIAIKPAPLVLVPFFIWRRQWRPLAWTAGGLLALFVATLLVGWGPRWGEFVVVLGPLGRGTAFVDNMSLNGFLLRLWRPELSGLPIEPLPPWFLAVWYVLEAAVFGIVLLAIRRSRGAEPLRTWTQVAILLAVVPMLEPYAWYHHYVFLVPALVVGIRLARIGVIDAWAKGGLLVAYVVIAVAFFIEASSFGIGGARLAQHPLERFGVSLPLLGALLLIASLVRRGDRALVDST